MHYDLMIIGESPSHTRPKGMENVHFSGKTSHILWDELRKHNITRDNCFVTNIVTKPCPRGTKPTSEMISEGVDQLAKDLKKVDPLLIMTVGKLATEEMIRMKVGSFTELAGRILGPPDWPKKWIVPCIHPAAVARNPELKKLFEDCIWTVAQVLKEIRKTITEEQR